VLTFTKSRSSTLTMDAAIQPNLTRPALNDMEFGYFLSGQRLPLPPSTIDDPHDIPEGKMLTIEQVQRILERVQRWVESTNGIEMEEVEGFEVHWDYVESTNSMDVVAEKTCDSGSVVSSYGLVGVSELSGQEPASNPNAMGTDAIHPFSNQASSVHVKADGQTASGGKDKLSASSSWERIFGTLADKVKRSTSKSVPPASPPPIVKDEQVSRSSKQSRGLSTRGRFAKFWGKDGPPMYEN
jgi:hypothetical protein